VIRAKLSCRHSIPAATVCTWSHTAAAVALSPLQEPLSGLDLQRLDSTSKRKRAVCL
jgi:hypothetical protein